MKKCFFALLFCFTVFLVLAGLFSCGGGGGGSASFSLHQPDDDLRNGGVSHGFGGNNNSSINSSRGGSATVVLTGSTSLNVDHYVYNGQSYSTAQELLEVMTGQNLTGETLIDVYVPGEATPRKAKYVVTASGPVLRHPYKITIEDESGNPLFESVSSSGGDPQYVYSSEGIVVDADMIGNSGAYTDPMTISIDGTYVHFPVEKYLVNNGPAAVALNGRITGFGEGDIITLTPKIGKYALDLQFRLGISNECPVSGETINVQSTDGDNGKLSSVYIRSNIERVSLNLSNCTYVDGTGTPQTTWPEDVISNSSQSKVAELTLPSSGITELASYAFGGNESSPYTQLTKISLPAGLEAIGNYAFANCTTLSTINIPNTVTSIGSQAFFGCTSLPAALTLPANLEEISNGTFMNCTSLTTITIPGIVYTIGQNAFKGCTGLTQVTIQDGVYIIDESAFQNCTSLSTVEIPASVRYIEANAFDGCNIGTLIFHSNPTNDINCNSTAFRSGQTATYNGYNYQFVDLGSGGQWMLVF